MTKNGLDKAQARAFQQRWRLVAAKERTLQRKETPARKLQQLNRLWAWGKPLGAKRRNSNEVVEVRRRWLKLRRIYLGSKI